MQRLEACALDSDHDCKAETIKVGHTGRRPPHLEADDIADGEGVGPDGSISSVGGTRCWSTWQVSNSQQVHQLYTLCGQCCPWK
ncbi:hypothetical protein FKM82_013401 [Ascaphus truei]